MAGYIKKRVDECERKDGTKYKRTRWRAIMPDPSKPASASAKIERTFSTKGDAEEWLHDQRSAVKGGSYVAPTKGKTPLKDVAEIWKATWAPKKLALKTRRDYQSILDNHVLPTFGDVAVSSINSVNVEEWLDVLGAKQLSPETIHHAYCVLKQCMKTAVRHKLIATNPCNAGSVDLPSKRGVQMTQLALEASEVRQLVDAMPERWRTPTLVAAWCGLRAGELWALRRGDVELHDIGSKLHVRGGLKDVWGDLSAGPTKTHQNRSMTIPPPLIPALQAALDAPGLRIRKVRRALKTGPATPIHGGYPCVKDGVLGWTDDPQDSDRLLFTTRKGLAVRHGNFYRREFLPTVAALWPEPHRLSKLRWHDLRHTCASLSLAATGGNLHVVKERLGHEDIKTTVNRYGHMLPSVDVALADALGAMWDATEPATVVELPAAEEA